MEIPYSKLLKVALDGIKIRPPNRTAIINNLVVLCTVGLIMLSMIVQSSRTSSQTAKQDAPQQPTSTSPKTEVPPCSHHASSDQQCPFMKSRKPDSAEDGPCPMVNERWESIFDFVEDVGQMPHHEAALILNVLHMRDTDWHAQPDGIQDLDDSIVLILPYGRMSGIQDGIWFEVTYRGMLLGYGRIRKLRGSTCEIVVAVYRRFNPWELADMQVRPIVPPAIDKKCYEFIETIYKQNLQCTARSEI